MHGRARPITLALAAAALASVGCARVRGTAANPAVTKLELAGTREFDSGEIVDRIATQESEGPLPIPILGPILHQLALELEVSEDAPPPRVPIVGPVVRSFRLAVGGVDVRTYDPDALALDRRRIEAWYRERGYYLARVTDVKVTPDGEGRVEVRLTVDEGRPARVAKVELRGLDAAPEAAAAVGKLALKVGDVFTTAAYDAARAQLEAALHQTGYATGKVTQTARVLPEERSAEVVYDVKPGQRLRFGALFVAGTAAVRRDLIRQMVAIEVRTGEWYDERKLARAQARVFDLGVFAGVRVTRGEPDEARATVPVVVAVREAPFRTVRLGPGLNFDSTRWDASGQASWTNRNYFGELRRLSADLKAGYAWLPTPFGANKEGLIGLVGLSFAQPVVAFGRVDATARIEVERGLESSYDFWAERLQLGAPIRLGPRWAFVPSYNFEVYQLSGVPSAADEEDNQSLEACSNADRTSGLCLLTYFEQRIAWDGRDSSVNTRRGLFVSLAMQEGFDVFGGGYRYLRFLPEVRAYLPLGSSVLALRARFGALLPTGEQDTPPPTVLLYGGGPSSIRGYNTRQFSQLKKECETCSTWVPEGANGLADASIELRFDLGGSWGGALFLDAAGVSRASNASDEFLKALDFSTGAENIQLAAGASLRYGTPFGPLRLDVGVRLPNDLSPGVPFEHRFPTAPWTDGEEGRPGAHREHIAAVHLLLGEAF